MQRLYMDLNSEKLYQILVRGHVAMFVCSQYSLG
ncbi:hypothetical protein NSTC745_05439 [Nostoc sp. DSM 114161]|jgi:hypothetical protein